jgi:hypothetical protein
VTFGNIRRNRDRGALKLRDDSKLLSRGELAGQPIGLNDQRHALLPNNEVAVTLDHISGQKK